MSNPDPDPVESTGERPGIIRELLVEVFLARGAAHHDDLGEAADEFRELFARFGILSDENEALIRGALVRLERRAGRSPLRLVTSGAADDEPSGP